MIASARRIDSTTHQVVDRREIVVDVELHRNVEAARAIEPTTTAALTTDDNTADANHDHDHGRWQHQAS